MIIIYITLTVIRKSISFNLKAFIFLGIISLAGFWGLSTFGLVGFGLHCFVFVAIYIGLLFNTKYAIWSLLISTIVFCFSALAVGMGWITYNFNIEVYSKSISTWATAIISFLVIYGSIVVSLGKLHKGFIASIKEKDVLLQEIYHKTKNSMQVINSMILLKAEQTQNREVKNIARDIQSKIMSMSLVHQKLYQSKDLSNINIQDYISELVQLIKENYNISENKISYKLEIENHYLLIDVVIPLGLILTELLTNAHKYAFPNNRQGIIIITFSQEKTKSFKLSFSDNGVGVPNSFDFRSQATLGLQTIFALGEEQMQGNVKFENDYGVKCTIEFFDNQYNRRI